MKSFSSLATGSLAIAVLGLSLYSCTASLDLERFQKQSSGLGDGGVLSFTPLRFNARGMLSHVNENFEIRVVDNDNRVAAKIVYASVVEPNFTIHAASLIPRSKPPYRVDFWADHNKSGKYDGITGGIDEKDHAWRRVFREPLPEDVRLAEGRYEVNFVHDTDFVDLLVDLDGNKIAAEETLLPLNLKVTGVTGFGGRHIDIRVFEKESGKMVAMHRQAQLTDSYVAAVTGVLDSGTAYELQIYADANNDKKFSAGDPSWKTEVISTSVGIDTTLNLSTLPQSPIETGEP